MAKRKFEVSFEGTAIIELDDKVIDVVDDEWRKQLYALQTPNEIAAHVGYNLVVNCAQLTQLDGWAGSDMRDDMAKVVEHPDWTAVATEIT